VQDVPVGSVTNGIHIPSWDAVPADDLWTEICGKDRWLGETEELAGKIRSASDERLWQMRNESRKALIDFTHARITQQLVARGESPEAIEQSKLLDPHVLTLGFARRFATYKRPNLLLHDPERLLRILTNVERPVQLILAGKAHPNDIPGQQLIQRWIQFIHNNYEARSHVVFLSDYDMLLTEQLVQGVDVWINTPQRPWEASGTSGMKILVNGGLNLSELDGWWAEAYRPDVGWALGDGKEHDSDPAWNASEANALYDILEREVIPQFYTRDSRGIPQAWIAKVRESMAHLTPHFSANRVVREYTEQYYLSAAKGYRERSANQAAVAKEMINFKHCLEQNWSKLRFGEMKVVTKPNEHQIEIQVFLDGLEPSKVKIELFADGSPPLRQEMKNMRKLDAPHAFVYGCSIPASFSPQLVTPRIIPAFPGVAVPLELSQILWQK
jgi:glycogen phosphorylase